MPTDHARLSASSADRWMHCPGSVALAEQMPQPKSTTYAEEGTVAHSLADISLRAAIHGKRSLDTADKKELKAIKANGYYSEEMEEAVGIYVSYIQELFAAAGPDAVLMTEQRLDLTEWVPEGFGTSDALVIGDRTVHVIDFKYGKGKPVDAENNPQIRLYALGVLDLLDGLYDIDHVQTVIIQPRLKSITTEDISVEDLRKWGAEAVRPQAEKAMDGCEEYAAGKWCDFCPCKPVCKERAKVKEEIAKHDFQDPMLMDPDEVAEALESADDYIAWINSLKAYALETALNGQHYAGWKVVEGRSTRQYADELKVADKLRQSGFEDAMIYERKLYGITAMEKIVGKKKFSEILGDLIVKPEGKPTLVPESDKREAFTPQMRAAADFSD